MLTFKEFVITDTHQHESFEKMFSCFRAHIGTVRGQGDVSSNHFKVDVDQCRHEYHEALFQETAGCAQVSANTIIQSSIRHLTAEIIRRITGNIDSTGTDARRSDVVGSVLETGSFPDSAIVNTSDIVPIDDSDFTVTHGAKRKRKRELTPTCTVLNTELIVRQQRAESLTKRHSSLDRAKFWKLTSSGRCVEDILRLVAISRCSNVKVLSYTIDFNCEQTWALFQEAEWEEIKEHNYFVLPRLPKSTEKYLRAVRNAVMNDKHSASISLHSEVPSAFANSALTEAFWHREAWPLLKNLLSDVYGISMVDDEKQGSESSPHRSHADMEGAALRKHRTTRSNLVAHDSVNKRDWLVVESSEGWDLQSRKYQAEQDIKVFRNLHRIAALRLAEEPSANFREKARFFSIGAGGRGFVTMEIRACPASGYVMLAHTYDGHELPATIGSWNLHCQGLTHLLQVRTTIARYSIAATTESNIDSDGDSWLYRSSQKSLVYDPTLCSSPTGPEYDE